MVGGFNGRVEVVDLLEQLSEHERVKPLNLHVHLRHGGVFSGVPNSIEIDIGAGEQAIEHFCEMHRYSLLTSHCEFLLSGLQRKEFDWVGLRGYELLILHGESPPAILEASWYTEIKEVPHTVDYEHRILTLLVVLHCILNEGGFSKLGRVVGNAEEMACDAFGRIEDLVDSGSQARYDCEPKNAPIGQRPRVVRELAVLALPIFSRTAHDEIKECLIGRTKTL